MRADVSNHIEVEGPEEEVTALHTEVLAGGPLFSNADEPCSVSGQPDRARLVFTSAEPPGKFPQAMNNESAHMNDDNHTSTLTPCVDGTARVLGLLNEVVTEARALADQDEPNRYLSLIRSLQQVAENTDAAARAATRDGQDISERAMGRMLIILVCLAALVEEAEPTKAVSVNACLSQVTSTPLLALKQAARELLYAECYSSRASHLWRH